MSIQYIKKNSSNCGPFERISSALIPYLPPANEVCEGYVFTPVCQSFCSQWGVPGQVHPPGRYPLAGTPPWAGTSHGQVQPSWAGTPQAGTPLGRHTPTPWASTPPWQVHPPGRYTPWQVHSPGRYTPLTRQVHPPGRYSPPPRAVHAGRYGQQADGTHPTGMHFCFEMKL